MNYKDFNLGDWIGHISGVIEDESELDGNEMRDLVEFLTTLKQEPLTDVLDKIRADVEHIEVWECSPDGHSAIIRSGEHIKNIVIEIIDKYRKGNNE